MKSFSIWINKRQNIKIICKTTLQGKVINWLRVCKWRLYDDKWTSDNDLWAPLIFPQYGDPFEETAPDSISTTQGRPIKLDEYLCSRYIKTLLKPSFIRQWIVIGGPVTGIYWYTGEWLPGLTSWLNLWDLYCLATRENKNGRSTHREICLRGDIHRLNILEWFLNHWLRFYGGDHKPITF